MTSKTVYTHGTPFDQENPEAYIPPGYYDLAKDPPSRRSIPQRLVSSIIMLAFATGPYAEIIDRIGTAVILRHKCDQDLAPVTSPEDLELRTVLSEVAEMKTGIDDRVFVALYDQAEEAESIEELETVLNTAGGANDISFYFGKIKKGKIGVYPVGHNGIIHDPSQLTFKKAKGATLSVLIALNQIPKSFLDEIHHSEIYLTTGLSNKDVIKESQRLKNARFVLGGVANHDTFFDVPSVIINVDEDIFSVGESLKHEIAHLLIAKKCGVQANSGQLPITKVNPASFAYTNDWEAGDRESKQKSVVSNYAATNASEDAAETMVAILSGKYSKADIWQYPVLKAKADILIAMFSDIEPRLLEYCVFLGLDYMVSQPQTVAQIILEDLTPGKHNH